MTPRPPLAADDPALPALRALDRAWADACAVQARLTGRPFPPTSAPATVAAGAPGEAGRDASVDQHNAVPAAQRN